KGKVSPDLAGAIVATRDALKDKNLDLAYELSSVKSFVTGRIDPTDMEHHFQEDRDANAKILRGSSVYSELDGLHHDLAWEVDKMPSGMVVMSANGMAEKGQAMISHPTIRLINQERDVIERRARAENAAWREQYPRN